MARTSPKKFRFNRWLWVGILILIISALGIRAFLSSSHSRNGPEMHPIPVATAKAVKGELKLFLSGLGNATPANNVLVRSRVDGELLRVHFQEGQNVKAGDLLAEIDPRPYKVQLMQAEGQLARDNALLKNAQIDLERYRTLWSQDSIAQQQVAAQEALVRQYEGTVKVDEGQVADAKLQLSYAKITAPASGRIGLRQVDPGNIVHASDATGIVSIAQVQPIFVVFTLPEDNLPRLMQKLNSKITLTVDAYDRERKFKLASGALLTVDNQIDTTTGTVKLKAQFPNQDSALFPNQFVNVRMQIDTLRDVVLLPVAAVQRGAQNNFVYLIKPDHTVTLRPVKVGDTEGDHIAIEEGVQPGDEVAIAGFDKLREGSAVETVVQHGVSKPAEQRTQPNGEHRKKREHKAQ